MIRTACTAFVAAAAASAASAQQAAPAEPAAASDDNASIYASYTQGYKSAVLDAGGGTGNPVLPETVNAFEVGFKHGRRGLSFETAAFYYDYRDLQGSLFTGNPPSARLVNAASSEIYGIEGQLRGDITDRRFVTQAQYNNFGIGAVWNQPVSYGIELGVKF